MILPKTNSGHFTKFKFLFTLQKHISVSYFMQYEREIYLIDNNVLFILTKKLKKIFALIKYNIKVL